VLDRLVILYQTLLYCQQTMPLHELPQR
jgi:hypothetical protein